VNFFLAPVQCQKHLPILICVTWVFVLIFLKGLLYGNMELHRGQGS
jgi:hypothetical protein